MAKSTINIEPEHKKNFDLYIIKELQKYFNNNLMDEGEELAKINLLINKDVIIDNILYNLNIEKQKTSSLYLNFKYYYDNNDLEHLFYNINKVYLKEYQNFFKAYKIQDKAIKEHYKTILYNKFIDDIKESKKYNISINLIIATMKKSEYKENVIKDLKETNEDLNINIINDLYFTVLNKAIKEYKQEADEEKELQKIAVKQNKKKKIALGWKVYGITKVMSKLWK